MSLVILRKMYILPRGKKVLKNHQKMMCQHALYSIGKFSYFCEHQSARSRARKNHVDNIKFYNNQIVVRV